jgi:protein-disulfide isomerase-like protein with CxxC motif
MTLEHVRTRLATSDQLRHLAAVIAYQIDTSDDDAHLLPYPNWQWGLTPLGLAFELVYMGWTAGPDNAVSNQWGPAVLSQEWQQPSRSGVTFTLAFAHSARVLWQADAVCEADIPAIVTQVLPVMRDLAALEVLHALAVAPVAH